MKRATEEAKRPQGRPPIPEEDRLVLVGVRMTPAQKAKLARIGGAARIREWLDRVRED